MAITLLIGNKIYSSWSLRPWLFLKRHGIVCKEVRIPLFRDDTPDRIAEFSSVGKLPVILGNDLTVWDSLAILEYLAERFPQHRDSRYRRPQPATKVLPDVAHKEVERNFRIWRECGESNAAAGA